MRVLQEGDFSSGGDQQGIKQLLLKITAPVLDKRQFALCLPVAYSTQFKVLQTKEANNNSIIVWGLFTSLFVATDDAQGFCGTVTQLQTCNMGASLTSPQFLL